MGFFKRRQRGAFRRALEDTAQISLKTLKGIDKKLKKIPGFSEQQADPAYIHFEDQKNQLLLHDKSEGSLKLANRYQTKIDMAYEKATGHSYKKSKGKIPAAAFLLIGAAFGYLINNAAVTGYVVSSAPIQQNTSVIIPLFLFTLGILLLNLKK